MFLTNEIYLFCNILKYIGKDVSYSNHSYCVVDLLGISYIHKGKMELLRNEPGDVVKGEKET